MIDPNRIPQAALLIDAVTKHLPGKVRDLQKAFRREGFSANEAYDLTKTTLVSLFAVPGPGEFPEPTQTE